MSLVPASQFSIEALTDLYNRSRADYLIPMQLDAAGLADYIHLYDVDLARSWVARRGAAELGLAMLGTRPGRAWITRLGVLPDARRSGAGGRLLRALLEAARGADTPQVVLEVIQGNAPAQTLFLKHGFRPTRELLVLRRPPGPPSEAPVGEVAWLEQAQALALLARYPVQLPWTNQPETYRNAGDGQGLRVDLGAAGRGWLVFRRQPELLSHCVLHTEGGDPEVVGGALLAHLLARYPGLPASLENVPADDPHLPALLRAGCQEAFRRIEMNWHEGE